MHLLRIGYVNSLNVANKCSSILNKEIGKIAFYEKKTIFAINQRI